MTEQGREATSQSVNNEEVIVESVNVDEFLPQDWTANVVAELAAWRQGDLIEGSPRFWATPADVDEVLGTAAGDSDWDVIDVESGEGWVIVTSQTCDIGGTGPGQKHPFIQVSPIFRFPGDYDPQKLEAVATWGVTYFAPLTNPPGDGFWAADLRLSMPISKGLLLGRTPMHAFAAETDAMNFSEALASRMRRPAIHDILSFDVPRALSDYIKTTEKKKPEWWEHVEQVRLLIVGDRLAPTSVGFVIVESVPLTPEQRAVWRGWRKQCGKLLRPHRISVMPNSCGTLDQLTARLYKESVPIRLPELSRPPVW